MAHAPPVPAPASAWGSRWATAALRLAALGATAGVALDAMHVHTATTRYPAPWVFGVATWTFPLFTGAAVAVGLGPCAVDRALGRAVAPVSARRALTAMALFVAAYAASCFFPGARGVAVLAPLAAAAWWAAGRRFGDLPHAAAAALGGVCVEVTLVRAGAFSHRDAALWGVPPWLPLLYAAASFGVSSLTRRWVAA